MKRRYRFLIHAVLVLLAVQTLLPFAFMVNNIFRTNSEFYHSFFSVPDAFKGLARTAYRYVTFNAETLEVEDPETGLKQPATRSEAIGHYAGLSARGPKMAWRVLRPYMLNSFIVSLLTATGVAFIGSTTAYILARYRFIGAKPVFVMFLATMMFPGVLTLVPSFLLVKHFGLLNSYAGMILPYIAGGQVFAIFVFRSFFMGLPEELFESARIDGAGHFAIYWHLVVPLSKPAFSVVIIMNLLGTWNNFLWPFIVNTDGSHHVVASGLYTMATSQHASNFSTMYAAYAVSSLPMLVLFIYATKPFIRGVTTGGLKA
jgi:ABC-type glycerol-3-phosphate transport system permease component